jgi:hypothetical protein
LSLSGTTDVRSRRLCLRASITKSNNKEVENGSASTAAKEKKNPLACRAGGGKNGKQPKQQKDVRAMLGVEARERGRTKIQKKKNMNKGEREKCRCVRSTRNKTGRAKRAFFKKK